jgi:hypothetical protein
MKKTYLNMLLLLCLFFFLIVSSVNAAQIIRVELFYSHECPSCIPAYEEVIAVQNHYTEENQNKYIDVEIKDLYQNDSYLEDWILRKLKTFPIVVINNDTIIPKENITAENLIRIIDLYIANQTVNESYDPLSVFIPFFGRVNMTAYSLPILTIILGGLDSINPCSFFILIFLMNLLLYMRSRKRMALVGGIFVFFSGFFYFLFMFALIHLLTVTAASIQLISYIAGGIAIVFGVFNIKDFFAPKKGPSLGLSDEQKPKIFQKMRSLVHTTSIPAVIAGAVFLAVTVNFYELLCTLGFPMVFTSILTLHNLSMIQYYLYILLYNIIYVIPLLVIVCIFVVTLGRWKLSEWQGQQLKLFSGIMIFSFGVLFLVNYQLLSMFFTPIILFITSTMITVILSRTYRYVQNNKQIKEKKK